MTTLPPLYVPEVMKQALTQGADCGISISGGKDSQALLTTFTQWHREQRFPGQLFALHADLGRAEWVETPACVETLCATLSVPLVVVRRTQGDLLDRFQERMHKLAGRGTPFWPTRGQRYCTSDLKRGPCDRHLRTSPLIISCEGIRADESDERAEKAPLTVRRSITGVRYQALPPEAAWTKYLQDRAALARFPRQQGLFEENVAEDEQKHALPRLALTLYPLFYWNLAAVWAACGTTQPELDARRALYQEGIKSQDAGKRATALAGWPAHPAYVKGARRLSCSLCILGDLETLRAGAYHQPDYYRALVWLEIEAGCPFQAHRWLADSASELLTEEQRVALAELPQRIVWLEKRRKRKVLPMYTPP